MNSFVSIEEQFIMPRKWSVSFNSNIFFITIMFDHPMILKYTNTFVCATPMRKMLQSAYGTQNEIFLAIPGTLWKENPPYSLSSFEEEFF